MATQKLLDINPSDSDEVKAKKLLADSQELNARMTASLWFIGGSNRTLIPPPSTPLDINPSDSDKVKAEKLLRASQELNARMEAVLPFIGGNASRYQPV